MTNVVLVMIKIKIHWFHFLATRQFYENVANTTNFWDEICQGTCFEFSNSFVYSGHFIVQLNQVNLICYKTLPPTRTSL